MKQSRRENKDKTREAFQKLKAENNRLRKEVAQLRKALTSHLHLIDEINFHALDDDWKPAKPKLKCPKCNSHEVSLIILGKFKIKICDLCGHKRRENNS